MYYTRIHRYNQAGEKYIHYFDYYIGLEKKEFLLPQLNIKAISSHK